MKNISLSLIGKIDPKTVEVLRTVNAVLAELEIAYVIVGATARDLVLHFGHGAKIQRATADVDFAIQVSDWEAFNQLKDRLCEEGFETTDELQRLYGPNKEPIDMVPFGGIEDKGANIAWPPKGDIAMSALGFSEACQNADKVLIADDPQTAVPVATPIGLMLLKLIAWTDRSPELRPKDALDIKYLLTNYEEISIVKDQAYDQANSDLMESYDWDLTLASSYILGVDVNNIAKDETRAVLTDLVQGQLSNLSVESLVDEMTQGNDLERKRNEQLIDAFYAGLSR